MKRVFLSIIFATLIPTLCHGQEDHSGITALSPELRELFSREMIELQKGMQSIIPAYISGDWGKIASIAGKMEGSYVLKQSLSKEQTKELHSRLPGSFLELDQQFHYLSGMLEHAASMEKVELIRFYFSKMSEACVSCHTQHATHKFPALAPKIEPHGHSH